LQVSVPLTPEIFSAFGLPVLVRKPSDWESVNDRLKTQILESRAADLEGKESERSGWQSATGLWGLPPSEEFEIWRGWVHDGMLNMAALLGDGHRPNDIDIDYVAGAWACVDERGNFSEPLAHPAVDWTCIYFVSCGTPEPGWERNGQFELRDPRLRAQGSKLGGYGFGRSLLIDPEPGTMILFPAWMEHGIHPFYGEGERIAITCNIKVTGGRHSGKSA